VSDRPLKVIFHLDGTGVLYNPLEPMHLDGLIFWSLCVYHVNGEPPRRDEIPEEIPLPLRRWKIDGSWGWHASALFPDGIDVPSLQFWRKKFRESRVEFVKANRIDGIYRTWQMPMQLVLCPRMIAYAHGDRSDIQRLLRRGIKYIGKRTSMGKGRVVGIDVEWIEEDQSLMHAGQAMRWLPLNGGPRFVRTRPPYWNNVGKIECCEVGSEMNSQ